MAERESERLAASNAGDFKDAVVSRGDTRGATDKAPSGFQGDVPGAPGDGVSAASHRVSPSPGTVPPTALAEHTVMMNAWAQVRENGPWHQVEYDSRSGLVHLACGGSFDAVECQRVLDYRCRRTPVCKHTACQREVGG